VSTFGWARWEERIVNLAPEYEDCKRWALKKGIPLKEVFGEAGKEAMTLLRKRS
jgi:uncharacterized protein (DUF111 family)